MDENNSDRQGNFYWIKPVEGEEGVYELSAPYGKTLSPREAIPVVKTEKSLDTVVDDINADDFVFLLEEGVEEPFPLAVIIFDAEAADELEALSDALGCEVRLAA